MKKFRNILLGFFAFSFFSCSPVIRINGTVEVVNVELPWRLPIELVLSDPITSQTIQVPTKVNSKGNFRATVKGENLFLHLVSVAMGDYVLGGDWFFQEPVYLEAGQEVILDDLYLSKKFALESQDGINEYSSTSELNISWDNIESADYYGVYIQENIEMETLEQGKIITLFVTKNPYMSNASSAPIIPRDKELNRDEVVNSAPFFRTNEEAKSGEYVLKVLAFKVIRDDFELIIAWSEEILITIE